MTNGYPTISPVSQDILNRLERGLVAHLSLPADHECACSIDCFGDSSDDCFCDSEAEIYAKFEDISSRKKLQFVYGGVITGIFGKRFWVSVSQETANRCMGYHKVLFISAAHLAFKIHTYQIDHGLEVI